MNARKNPHGSHTFDRVNIEPFQECGGMPHRTIVDDDKWQRPEIKNISPRTPNCQCQGAPHRSTRHSPRPSIRFHLTQKRRHRYPSSKAQVPCEGHTDRDRQGARHFRCQPMTKTEHNAAVESQLGFFGTPMGCLPMHGGSYHHAGKTIKFEVPNSSGRNMDQ